MDLDLFFRRKYMLKLHYANSLNAKTIRGLAEQSHVSEQTIRKDWNRRPVWEPLIWAMSDCKNDAELILRGFLFAKEQALKLMGSADQDRVKVAAIGRYTDIIRLEIELRQSLGKLPKVSVAPQINLGVDVSVQNQINVNGTPELSEYERIVKRIQMENISKVCSQE